MKQSKVEGVQLLEQMFEKLNFQQYYPHAPRRQGPSRRARRVKAGVNAAVKVYVQTIEEEIKTGDAAVQAAFNSQPAVPFLRAPQLQGLSLKLHY